MQTTQEYQCGLVQAYAQSQLTELDRQEGLRIEELLLLLKEQSQLQEAITEREQAISAIRGARQAYQDIINEFGA